MSKQGVDFQGTPGRQVLSQNRALGQKNTLIESGFRGGSCTLHGDSELAGKRLGREVEPIH